ncbi:MAG: TonB-dependent receptor [Pyrinomonadaceae bacterium]
MLPAGATISNADVSSANSLFSLLGGIIGTGTQTFNPTSRSGGFAPTSTIQDFAYDNYAAYVSDQWRVSPALTLNVGLRYELTTGLKIQNGLALEPLIPEGVDARTAVLNPSGGYGFIGTNAGVDTQLYKSDKNNFAPILSFAYSPQFKNNFLGSVFGEGRTVIRGGF